VCQEGVKERYGFEDKTVVAVEDGSCFDVESAADMEEVDGDG
jgi:hypothetical protein